MNSFCSYITLTKKSRSSPQRNAQPKWASLKVKKVACSEEMTLHPTESRNKKKWCTPVNTSTQHDHQHNKLSALAMWDCSTPPFRSETITHSGLSRYQGGVLMGGVSHTAWKTICVMRWCVDDSDCGDVLMCCIGVVMACVNVLMCWCLSWWRGDDCGACLWILSGDVCRYCLFQLFSF